MARRGVRKGSKRTGGARKRSARGGASRKRAGARKATARKATARTRARKTGKRAAGRKSTARGAARKTVSRKRTGGAPKTGGGAAVPLKTDSSRAGVMGGGGRDRDEMTGGTDDIFTGAEERDLGGLVDEDLDR